MKSKMGKIFAGFIFIVFMLGLLSMFIGCQSPPKKADFAIDDCFLFADCMYRDKDNKDKSSCAILGQSCTDALKEKRYYERIEYCSKTKPTDMTGNECRLYLNQK